MKKNTLSITGGKPLEGEIQLRGAKNALSKIMVAALLSDEPSVLHNIANVVDVDVVTKMIELLGGSVKNDGNGTITIHAKNLQPASPNELHNVAGTSRIPILFAGPLLHRAGKAVLPELGGCEIGKRPVDFHLQALGELGAQEHDIDGGYELVAKQLHGAKISLTYPSVMATEQVLLSAVLARGVTELRNAAVEPEIIDLICVLQKMGAIIAVDTDRVITINGVNKLHGFEHSVMPDRIEAGSWACAAAATNGRIFVRGAVQSDMMTFLNAFRLVGCEYRVSPDGIEFWRGNKTTPISLETDVHPGFMTDWQQPFTVLLTQIDGLSIVHETVYEDRFGFTNTLNDMGAQIQLYQNCLGKLPCRFAQSNYLHSAVISGPTKLRAREITVPDLRAGFSYVIATLVAEGTSTIHNIDLIDRGYEDFNKKLKSIGATID